MKSDVNMITCRVRRSWKEAIRIDWGERRNKVRSRTVRRGEKHCRNSRQTYRKGESGNPIRRPHGERDQHEALASQQKRGERGDGQDQSLPLTRQRAARVGRDTPGEIVEAG